MPCLDAPPSPPKKDSGTETTSAQGQETTKKFSARSAHSAHAPPKKIGGIRNSSRALMTTQGVYTLAKRVIKPSTFAFLEADSSIRFRI